MSTLPFAVPPGCVQPATDRVEVYSGTYASLDAAAYTCPQHTDDVALAVIAGGLTPYQVHVGPGVSRSCGYVYVYPTGTFGGVAR
ncbi:hypothetical protein ACLQ24_22935 [Micromonospora sp. DT4]|uniref:hypothetical protein n=1 Tax=Micromonospora sp. DT4 TaxID=3393438 RepID=UPI003CEA8DA2